MESTAPKYLATKWKQWKRTVSWVFTFVFVVGVIGAAAWRTYDLNEKREIQLNEQIELMRKTTCPSLFSIARTPNDTLIVMKYVRFCDEPIYTSMH